MYPILCILFLALVVFARCEIPSYFCSDEFKTRREAFDQFNNTRFLEVFNAEAFWQVKPSSRYYMDKFLQSLVSTEEKTSIVWFGGSMVIGYGCKQPEYGLWLSNCAYPSRVQRKLSELVGNRELAVVNKAMGGSTTGGYLPALPIVMREFDEMPAAVFIDFSVNDAREIQDWSGEIRLRGAHNDVKKDKVLHATESFVRFLRSAYPDLPVFLVEAFPYEDGLHSFLAHKLVAEQYDVPFLSYRSAVDPEAVKDSMVWGSKKDEVGHPSWIIHENLAFAIVNALLAGVGQRCSPPTSEEFLPLAYDPPALLSSPEALPAPVSAEEDLANFQVCEHPTSYFHAYKEFGKPPSPDIKVLTGNWTLFPDRPGKPGWIASKPNSLIDFRVKFGANPRLIIGFLRSYEGLGDAYLNFPEIIPRRHLLLPGLEKEQRASQTYSLNLNVKQKAFHETFGLNGVLGWGIEPFTNTTIRFRSTGKNKFKLVYVIAC